MSGRPAKLDLIPLIRVYDLRTADGWRQAHLHRRLWGRLYVDAFPLDDNHVVLVFSSAGERWRAWEEARRRFMDRYLIQDQREGGRAA